MSVGLETVRSDLLSIDLLENLMETWCGAIRRKSSNPTWNTNRDDSRALSWQDEAPVTASEVRKGGMTLTFQSNAPITRELVNAYLSNAVRGP